MRQGERPNEAKHGHGDVGDTNNELACRKNDSAGHQFGSDLSRESIVVAASDNDSDDSDSDGGDDFDLPSDVLEFLSSQQNNVANQLSAIADQLRGIRYTSSLVQINFVRKFLSDRGAIAIANAIEDGCKNDDCSGNRHISLSPSPPDRCPSRHLRDIILSRCHIGNDGACALAHAISNSCVLLKTLDLTSNNITGVGVIYLANCTVGSCVGNSCNIETLSLSSNPILTEGALALANALEGHGSECPFNDGRNLDESASVSCTPGFCSLKVLHLSGCQLNDDDAILLGNALLPKRSYPDLFALKAAHLQSQRIEDDDEIHLLPSLPRTNRLMCLNLFANRIGLRGMEFLHSVIHYDSPDPISEASDDLQSLYCESNHAIELGVIVDYGTRDYNFGHFFNQEEDEQLLVNLRNYETTRTESNVGIGELRNLMRQKWILKEKMERDLVINRHCLWNLEQNSVRWGSSDQPSADIYSSPAPKEMLQILRAAASTKIERVLEEKLGPQLITLPKRQDELGNYIGEDKSGLLQCDGPLSKSPTIGKYMTGLDLNIFPYIFCWLNHHFRRPAALASVFDIICENPDVCGFHSHFPRG